MTRRLFLEGVLASAGTVAFAGVANGRANLKVGIVSDIHLSRPEKHNSQGAIDTFRKVLRFFKTEDVDSILLAGDLTNGGTADEIKICAEIWCEVFGSVDSGPVRIFVTGNHEKVYADDAPKCWQEIWGEPWTPFFIKNVKGYSFIGTHWAEWENHEALREFLASHDKKLRNGRPFFYTQHAHPQNTCYGSWTWHQHDGGRTSEVLSGYPNAVAFSGHTHYPLTDERSIWQGAFTSIGTGALRWLTPPAGRENGEMPKEVGSRMSREVWGDAQGMVMNVWNDRMVFERYDFTHMEKLGDDWVVPVPHDGSAVRKYSFERRFAESVAPEFPKGAKVAILERKGRDPNGAEEDQVIVRFPAAEKNVATSRVYDYEISAEIPLRNSDVTRTLCVKRIYQPGFMNTRSRDKVRELNCVFGKVEFQSMPCRFMVTPLNCFGKRGRPISANYRPSSRVQSRSVVDVI